MKLTFKQIKGITCGAVDVKYDENGFSFYRFTKDQQDCYEGRTERFYRNTFSTSGVKLAFRTDSENLSIAISTFPGSSRTYFSLDVCVNKCRIGSIDNFSELDTSRNYSGINAECGNFSKSFSLGCGIKDVCIHLPWSVITNITDMELDDGAFIEPIKYDKKLLAFGDSITQGYDALRPSSRHIAKLADALGAEEFNKAIGGERFWPQLASLRDSFSPDYIIIAYGTNDWRYWSDSLGGKKAKFFERCSLFFENIMKNYTNSKVFAITPLWRFDEDNPETDWPFEETEEMISRAAKANGIKVIRGFDFLPHDTELFADLRLHPSDKGFEHYFESLYEQIKQEI